MDSNFYEVMNNIVFQNDILGFLDNDTLTKTSWNSWVGDFFSPLNCQLKSISSIFSMFLWAIVHRNVVKVYRACTVYEISTRIEKVWDKNLATKWLGVCFSYTVFIGASCDIDITT